MKNHSYERNTVSSSGTGGIGFTGLLQIGFIILKLCHIIEWSWLWVLSPTWIPVLILTAMIIIVLLYSKG